MTTSTINTNRKYLQSFDDQSDRKALAELQKRLKNGNKSDISFNNSPKYKQLTIQNYCSKQEAVDTSETSSCNKCQIPIKINMRNKKKGKKVNHSKKDLTKITGWLSKRTHESTENQQIENVQSNMVNGKLPALGENYEPSERENYKRPKSNSFAKYGLHVPSFEDIVKSQKKYDDHQQYVNKLGKMDCSQESLKLDIDEPSFSEIALDCKHLTEKDIKKAFKKNKIYMHNIFHGTTYSERHKRFQKENPGDQFTSKDLKFNTSTLAFTYEQKQELLSLLCEYFDGDSELGINNMYLFKVLLPELCLKIFMDVHGMDLNEANRYLENMPLENRNTDK